LYKPFDLEVVDCHGQPNHCGCGKKYKKCCLPKEEAAERERLAEAEVMRAEPANAHRSELRETKAAILAKLAGVEVAEDELTTAPNDAADLVRAGKLDEAAEHAVRDLLVRFPEVHDGYDRLGMVYEARGENQKAADCYRKVIEHIRQHPDKYDEGFEVVRQARRSARPASRPLIQLAPRVLGEGATSSPITNHPQIAQATPSTAAEVLRCVTSCRRSTIEQASASPVGQEQELVLLA
jgi:tetratricopeptide (TPR) repeat protein